MLTLIFVVLFLGIFGKMIGFAVRASWSIMKVFFTILFLPAILIVLAVSGCIAVALPALIIVGIVMLVKAE